MTTPLESISPLARPAFLDALGKSLLLVGLSPEALRSFLVATDVVEVPQDETVVREGEPSGDMYFVLEGEARLRRHDLRLKTIGPGAHIGALGMLTGRPHSVTVTAAARLALARLTPARWRDLAERHPQLALALVTGLLLHAREELVEMTDQVGLLLQGRSLPRARQVEVRLQGEVRQVPTGALLGSLLPSEVAGSPVVAALLNQKPVSLNTPLFADASVAPLTVAESEGREVWARTLGLVLLEAARQIAPDLVVRMGPSRGTVQLVELHGTVAPADATSIADRISAGMERMVADDVPIRQELWAI